MKNNPQKLNPESPDREAKGKMRTNYTSPTEIGHVKPREIAEEMKESYIDYAMSVIVSRALPDVRDGLKPVHRRILYAMYEMGLKHDAKFRKSAAVTGEVLGKFHPHGDAPVYEALTRMAQDFSLRYPLVQGQGNFGCFTKDTKVRLCDGRNLSFEELIKEQKEGKKHWTFTFNPGTKKIEITEIKNPRLTKKNERIMEVTLDNGEKIKCTLDHLFMLRDGSYKQAKDLKPGDSLMPLYTKFYEEEDKNLKGYEMILQPMKEKWEFVHYLADRWNLRYRIYKRSAGRIRHHKDFNKLNNNPDNIIRIQWQDHWKYHKEIASFRHKNDSEYVAKLAEGRRKFIENNREIFSQWAKNLNKKLWKNPDFRKRHSERIKALWQNPEYRKYMAKVSSENLKRLWKRKDFQELLSKLKSEEMKKRWQDENYRNYWKEKTKGISLKIWSDPKHRDYISKLAKNQWKNHEYKEYIISCYKKKWKEDQEFRAKFNSILSENGKFNQKYRFLKTCQNLLKKYGEIFPEKYKKETKNYGGSCIISFEKALSKYFENDLRNVYLELERKNPINHKVREVKFLRKREDVYDLTTKPWHNFALAAGVFVHNSIDGDPPAAQRYTECRLSRIGEEMLRDIEKDTVDFTDNYDGTRKEPTVLPSPFPQLLLNGSLGIAVGMATNIPPHNLSEVCDATIYLIDHPKATTEDLFKFIKGPDFPTGGEIFDQKGIIQAYSQGKGPILVRGKAEIIETEGGRNQILITEIPFQVQKSSLIEQFANLVSEKKIEGVKNIRDESDKEGLRIVIDLQREAHPQKILNRLYKFTDLQKAFHLNMLALVEGIQPRVLSLVELLNYYILHKKEVVFRRTKYDLEKAKERNHILEGLHKCLAKIDAVIKTIKQSADRQQAQKNLMVRFRLTAIQANAILETKLSALAKLERKKIEEELEQTKKQIKELTAILKSPQKIKEVVKKELSSFKENFGDERRTKVHLQKVGEIAEEDLIPSEETIITLTQGGYIKRINPATYKLQKRGGKGIMGMKTIGEDIVAHFIVANTHDNLLFFTDSGKVFRMPVYEIPEGQRVAKGRGLLNFLEISAEEKILSLFPVGKKDQDLGIKYLLMVTKNGIIKKTPLEDFENVRRSGLLAISLKKDDLLRKVSKTTGGDEIILVTRKGQAIRFKEKEVRPMGRAASGVKGIRLRKGDEVVGMDVIKSQISNLKNQKPSPAKPGEVGEEAKPHRPSKINNYLLVVTENGYGKRTDLGEYRLQGRGGTGIKTAKVTPKTGELVASKVLTTEEDLIVISQRGQVIRTKISQIPKLSRSTQGVKIMRLEEGDRVASATCI